MKTVVLGDPPEVLVALFRERKRLGHDTHDELWNGDYHMSAATSFDHGHIAAELGCLLGPAADDAGLAGTMAFNVGTPDNFRVPDLGFHRGSPSGVWIAAAAIVVEVRSPDDETFDKFEFYFEHGVEELLVADLVTQRVRWFLRGDATLEYAEASALLGVSARDIEVALKWQIE